MKIKLIEVAILSRMLKQDDLTFDMVAQTASQLANAQMEIAKSFSQMANYESGKIPDAPLKANSEDIKYPKETNAIAGGKTIPTPGR